ncbi:SLAC1 family transporter [Streptomyces prunicolor]
MIRLSSTRSLAPTVPSTPRPPLNPSWFAAVMGTGIVANSAVTLPRSLPGLRTAATVIWVGAVLLLVVLAVDCLRDRDRDRAALRSHAADPVVAQFFGAPPMALLTVGAGALLLGRGVIGFDAALDVDRVLWSLGTVLDLATACTVPYLMVTRHRFAPDAAFGGWLMPVVPPMGSAATGALLVPPHPTRPTPAHPPPRLLRDTRLRPGRRATGPDHPLRPTRAPRRAHRRHGAHGVDRPRALGQAVTALGALATAAPSTLPALYARGAEVLALLGGILVWGFALLRLVLATDLTVQTLSAGLPFAPTWWSFIFPFGALVTATSTLAARTDAVLFVWPAVVCYALLVLAWVVVGGRSLRHIATRTVPSAAPRELINSPGQSG